MDFISFYYEQPLFKFNIYRMSGRLQLIEQKLLAIDGAKFQNLCDNYLSLREEEYSSLNRSGSQLGKQKTIVGTPDTFLRLSDNKLAYVEFTTQATSVVSKIKEDIDKCLDESKTGVNPKLIHKIVICLNTRLSLEEETSIQEYAQEKRISLELIGIDTLALEIMSKFLLLAREYLGIALDTGQILPFDKFISEYNNKANQLSTPLDNIFLHRNTELEQVEEALSNKDLLILSGAPGVGKTKLGIEAVQNFKKKNPSFESYVVAKKDVDIFEDLKIQLRPDKDYILLIDDANRQLPNLRQIFGIFREEGPGKLKLIITVRNYALVDIKTASIEYVSETIDIPKFSDEEIIEILKSDSYSIINHKYQKKIVEIADGNPRLAIMGARVALEKQSDFLFGDVADLFETYFSSFSMDFNLFDKPELLKALGLVSFFFTIERDNKETVEKLLTIFQIASLGTGEVEAFDVFSLFGKEVLGGILLGGILGWITYRLMKSIDDYDIEVIITLAAVMGGTVIAHKLHLSAPLAMVTAGLIVGNDTVRGSAMSEVTESYVDKFWELIDILLNTILFVLIGMEMLVLAFDGKYILAGLIAIPIILLCRYTSLLLPISFFKKRLDFVPKTNLIMTWGGLRGGISIALALGLTEAMHRDLFLVITYVVVVFSILIQIKPFRMNKKLKLLVC